VNAEAFRLLEFAGSKLSQAEKIYGIDLYEAAGREAYHAALAAARAVIVHAGKKAPKTHNGTRTVFAAVIRGGIGFDTRLGKFLAAGFEIKSAADYADGAPVNRADAEDALQTARAFLEAAKKVCA
jgi:uncharacterized protein (UPF0332 family)